MRKRGIDNSAAMEAVGCSFARMGDTLLCIVTSPSPGLARSILLPTRRNTGYLIWRTDETDALQHIAPHTVCRS